MGATIYPASANPDATGLAAIAAAVAAPSAATIATAVAAPSAATIATAVAAPSAATIAAAVPSIPRWVALQTSSLGVTTVTFSSLSGYSKYRCLFLGGVGNTFLGLAARINGDTTAGNYQWGGVQTAASATSGAVGGGSSGASNFQFAAQYSATGVVSSVYAEVEIEGCTLTAIKFMRGRGTAFGSAATDLIVEGGYNQTAAVTSITILNLGTGSMSGVLTLFGAN